MCPGPSAGFAVPAFAKGCPIGRRHAAFGISSAKHGRTTAQISTAQTSANIVRRTFSARQTHPVARDRRDPLQLRHVQNDLTPLALAMGDIRDAGEPYPLTAWSGQFQRIREDLHAALQLEESFSPAARTADQRQFLN